MAVYIRTHPGSVPTVKQHLAAIRMLGDWLVVSQVLPVNPPPGCEGRSTSSQRARRRSSRQAEARKVLQSIDTAALAGLRDRALLSVMLYSLARQRGLGDAAAGLLRAGETGLVEAPREGWGSDATSRPITARPRPSTPYLKASGLDEPKAPLFRTVEAAGRRLTGRALKRRLVLAMVKRRGRRAAALDVLPHVPGDGDHSVPVKRGDAGARAADLLARVTKDYKGVAPGALLG